MDATLARTIEHTRLDPPATAADVHALVREAVAANLFGVCVSSARVAAAREALAQLAGAGPRPVLVTVVGFPNGAVPTRAKVAEVEAVLAAGADELDVVADLGLLRAGEHASFVADLAAVVRVADGHVVKVILETGLLEPDEIVRAGRLALDAGAHILKTSTGMPGRGGATVEAVRALASLAPPLGVKASGGIRTAEDAHAMLQAGATRIGTSAGPRLVGATG